MPCFSRTQVHVPLFFLKKNMDLFLGRRLNPEIYLNHHALQRFTAADAERLAARLRGGGLTATVHGPFFDLSPGASDKSFRDLTLERMRDTLECSRPLAPQTVVFHPGYDPLRFAEHFPVWLKNSIRTWKGLLPKAESLLPGTWILIENIFERRPETLRELLLQLPSPPFGFCFDTGHFQVFSEAPLMEWLDLLGPFLREVHLHDNSGDRDAHLPPGRGVFDFPSLFGEIERLGHPVIGTIEAHSREDLRESIEYLQAQGVCR